MDKKMSNPWTEAELKIVESMAKEGKSASIIASALTGRTRNSVIGIMNRRNISHNSSPRQSNVPRVRKVKTERRVTMARLFMQTEEKENVELLEAPISRENYVRFLDRRFNQCKYIVEKRGDTYYCCGTPATHKGWCSLHAALVYRPLDPRPINRDGRDPPKQVSRSSE